mgnify:CR=1 FL=1
MVTEHIRKRVFIVGCSRSGTTVLQVSVASHPRMKSFPETFFFQHLYGKFRDIPLRFGLAGGREQWALEHVLKELDRPDLKSMIPEQSWWLRPYVDRYLTILDRLATEDGKDHWVEKTPMHIFRLWLILRYVPDVHIIHMVRDGRDVVASICDRAQQFEGEFPGQEDPAFGIDRWNRAMEVSSQYVGQPRHTFIFYDRFVRDPEAEMRRLCEDLDIAYHPVMATGSENVAANIIPDHRAWIQRAKKPPEAKNSKFERLFTPKQQHEITQALHLDVFRRIRKEVAPRASESSADH